MDDGIRGNGFGYHGTGTHHGFLADRYAREDRSVCPDRATLPQVSLQIPFRALSASGKGVIGKSDIWPDKDVILETGAIPKLDAAFNRDAVSKDDIILDEHVIANIAVAADLGVGKNMGKRPDSRPSSYLLGLTNRLGMNEVIHQFLFDCKLSLTS